MTRVKRARSASADIYRSPCWLSLNATIRSLGIQCSLCCHYTHTHTHTHTMRVQSALASRFFVFRAIACATKVGARPLFRGRFGDKNDSSDGKVQSGGKSKGRRGCCNARTWLVAARRIDASCEGVGMDSCCPWHNILACTCWW